MRLARASRMRSNNRRRAFLLVVTFLLPLVALAYGKTIGETLDDATITTRVKTALLNDPDANATRIDVNTTAGVVTLSGDVRSKSEADRAVQVAHGVAGVKDVRSALRIGA
jgi:osmotically-inducible protein OsmY